MEFRIQLLSLERSLLKFAYSLTLRKADAKDLVQDTFLRVLIGQDRYSDNKNFKAWTFKIMRNTFIDNYRYSSIRNKCLDLDNEEIYIDQTRCICSCDPDSVYSALEIEQNIEELKDKYRVPLEMLIRGYKYKEIADGLNLKIGTVKNRIFLSRRQLLNQLNR